MCYALLFCAESKDSTYFLAAKHEGSILFPMLALDSAKNTRTIERSRKGERKRGLNKFEMLLHFRFKLKFSQRYSKSNGNNSKYNLCIAKKYIAQDFLKRIKKKHEKSAVD